MVIILNLNVVEKKGHLASLPDPMGGTTLVQVTCRFGGTAFPLATLLYHVIGTIVNIMTTILKTHTHTHTHTHKGRVSVSMLAYMNR